MTPSAASTTMVINYLKAEWHAQLNSADPGRQPESREIEEANRHLSMLEGSPVTPASTIALGACYDVLVDGYLNCLMRDAETSAMQIAYQMERVKNEHPSRVIVAACGAGIDMGLFAYLWPRVQFIGYDISRESLAVAQRRCHRLGVRNVEFVYVDHAHAAKLIKTPAEIILCQQGYLIAEWIEAMKPMLTPGGVLILVNNQSKEAAAKYTHCAKMCGLAEEAQERQLFPWKAMHQVYDQFAKWRQSNPQAESPIPTENPRDTTAIDVLSYRKRG